MTDSIDRIYRAVPEVHCKGLCVQACGPVLYSATEADRIRQRHGTEPSFDATLRCTKLINGRCSIYEDRPLVCRLYGATPRMPCPWGCMPSKGMVPERAARKLLQRAEALS